MEARAAQARPARPVVVTIAVVIWWAALGFRLLASIPGLVAGLSETGGQLVGTIVAIVVVVGILGLLAWGVWRMGRGSGTARLCFAVLAVLGASTSVIVVLTGGPPWGLLESVVLVGAAVLTYLPSARVWFPKAERRPRRVEPKTVGWDPETGERITEDVPGDASATQR